jgi:hypothetical protein
MRLLTNKMKHFFLAYLKSNIHVSVCLIFYSLTISLKNDLLLTSNHILLMFLFVFGAYNFINFNEKIFSYQSKQSSKKLIFFYSFAFIFLSMVIFYFFGIIEQIIFLVLSLIIVLYSVPVFGKSSMRKNVVFKLLSVPISWATLIVLFPFHYVMELTTLIYYYIIIFLIIFAQMIPFEIRDFESDKKHFKNIIEIYGLNNIKNLGYCCLILVFLISFLMNENQIDFDLLVVAIILSILIKKATEKQKVYYSSFIVESLPVFWFFLVLNL